VYCIQLRCKAGSSLAIDSYILGMLNLSRSVGKQNGEYTRDLRLRNVFSLSSNHLKKFY
jgi:hypothetical protein